MRCAALSLDPGSMISLHVALLLGFERDKHMMIWSLHVVASACLIIVLLRLHIGPTHSGDIKRIFFVFGKDPLQMRPHQVSVAMMHGEKLRGEAQHLLALSNAAKQSGPAHHGA